MANRSHHLRKMTKGPSTELLEDAKSCSSLPQVTAAQHHAIWRHGDFILHMIYVGPCLRFPLVVGQFKGFW